MEKNPLDDIVNKYRHLKLLEKKYFADDLSKLDTYKEIIKLLEEIKIELTHFDEEFDSEYNKWKYHTIANRKYIEVMDNENLLKIICTAANMIKPDYAIKKLKVVELVSQEDVSYSILKFGTINILSDNETLATFNDDTKFYYYSLLIDKFNKLSKEKRSFIISSNLVNEYSGEYLKEKIGCLDTKDLIISVTPGSTLDECINKFAMYATKYGSDYNEKKINAIANLINYQPVKTRKLTDKKYIKYYDNNKE